MNKNRRQKTDFILCPLSSVFYFLSFAFCLLLFGCGTMPPVLSDAQMNAIEFNHRADRAFKNGDYKKAAILYNEALKVNRSIENIDGIAINLINLAVVYRKTGDKEIANRCIDEILNPSILISQHYMSEAAFLKAMLYFDEKNYDEALEWLNRSLSFCQGAVCNNKGKIYNLKGRISLSRGDIASAIAYGTKGLELNKEDEHKNEKANSLRLLADAKQAEGIYNEALNLYKEALAIDKSLSSSRKVALDLTGMGNAACKQGKPDEAVAYFKRAISVSKASGDNEGAEKIKALMEECLKKK